MSLADQASLLLIPTGYKSQKVYSIFPTDGDGDFDFSRSSSATRIAKNGLITTVAANVPRLNYPLIDGKVVGCPSLLLEPERTNLITYSEDFSQWSTVDSSVTDNNAISPDGSLNASLLTEGVTVSNHQINAPNASITTGLTYTFSVFVKNNGVDLFSITAGAFGSLAINSTFNLVTQTSTSLLGSSTIKKMGDYFLCTVTGVSTQTRNQSMLIILNKANIAYPFSYQGDGTSGIYIWGAQLEEGSYLTSYIPTNGSSVTRSAESANDAGTSDTFNDSEGVLMAEISALVSSDGSRDIEISDGNTNRIIIQYNSIGTIQVYVLVNGVATYTFEYTTLITQFNKIALKYKENDFALWVDGFEADSSNSGSVFSSNTLTQLDFLKGVDSSLNFYGNTKQIQYYNSALTDSELEKISSWTSFTDMATSQLYTIQ